MNPYGYLPGRLYPLLHFYGYMSLLYLVVSILWFILNAYFWRDIVMLQNFISLVLGLCMLEMTIWFFDYRNFNMTGIRHLGAWICAMLLSVLRRTFSRILVVIVSLGYGVCRPTLGDDSWKLITLGSIYFVAESALELLIRYDETDEVGTFWRVVLSLPPAILNAIVYWWIFLALSRLTEQLKIRRQDDKLQIFTQFTRVLMFSLLLAVGYAVYQMYYMSSGFEYSKWQNKWLLDTAIPELLYTLVLLTILILWRPSTNNKRFAYAQLAPTEATALPDDEDEFGALPVDQVPATAATNNRNGVEMKSMSKPRFTIGDDGEHDDDDDDEKHQATKETVSEQIPNPTSPKSTTDKVASLIQSVVGEENNAPVIGKVD